MKRKSSRTTQVSGYGTMSEGGCKFEGLALVVEYSTIIVVGYQTSGARWVRYGSDIIHC
jgi:hypothetical protein